MSIKKDLYKILKIPKDANIEEINVAYRVLAQEYHPDSPNANLEKYKEIRMAYEILVNFDKRKKYDQLINTSDNNDLPQVFPFLASEKTDLQSFINLIYEQINFESLNHNPTKARVYQEIYDELIKNRIKIESEDVDCNPLWRILKSYKPYILEDDFNRLVFIAKQIFNLSDDEAKRIINKSDTSDLSIKKYFGYILIGFLALVVLVFISTMIISKIFPPEFANANKVNNTEDNSIEENLDSNTMNFTAKIYDIGSPVNIRSAPTVEWQNIVARIKPGEEVSVLQVKTNGWYLIKKGEIEGFVYGGLLQNNDYPDSYPIVQVVANEIKVFDKEHKVVKVLKSGDRLIVMYHDNENYYVNSEKGNLIVIEKDSVLLENPKNTFIQYIDDAVKSTVEFSAIMPDSFTVEESDIPEDQLVEDEETIEENTESTEENSEESSLNEKPEVIFPGQQASREESTEQYVGYIKDKVISNWHVPNNLTSYNSAVVFRVSKDGRLLNVSLVQSSGLTFVDDASMKAVQNSAPFKPLPKNADKDYIDVKLNFDQ